MSKPVLPFDPVEKARENWAQRGWEAAAPGMAAVTSVMRTHQIFLARADQVLRPFDLTFARYETLMLLTFSQNGSLPLGKIGSRLQVHPASVTNAIDRLEAQGFVARAPHPEDRRATLAVITEKGLDVAERATTQLNAEVFEQVDLSASELTQLHALLRKVRRAEGDFA